MYDRSGIGSLTLSELREMRGRKHPATLSVSERRKIEADAENVLGITLNKQCPNCYNDAIVQLLIFHKKNMEKQKYLLKRGIVVRMHNRIYTWENLPDDVAEKWISQDYTRRDFFDRLARDYDDYEPKKSRNTAIISEE